MRRALAVVALALLALPALAEEPKPWPQKGDTVFLPAEISTTRHVYTTGSDPGLVITVPACAPMEVRGDPVPEKIVAEDQSRGVAFPICGEWRKWVRPTLKECKQLAASTPVSFQFKGAGSLRVSQVCYWPIE
jgi:hypothetical protein